MKTLYTIFFVASLMAVSLTCSKDDKDNDQKINETKTVSLDLHNDLFNWRYFSFEEGIEVHVVNYSDTLSWDLGMRYESFRTNGGKSGTGQGAVLDLGVVDFDVITFSDIAGKVFVEDDSITVLAAIGMPPVMARTPGSVPLEAMFLSPQGPPPHTYTPNNHVYIIRTAKGRHVKLKGTSFFNDLGQEGYFNFRYVFID
jgi:hypothetical protein